MGMAMIAMAVTYATLDLDTMVRWQARPLFAGVPAWGIFVQPLAFILFLTAAIAENKRIPFDLPECESELVSGYFTEYTSMKMGLFLLSEFIEIAVMSALVVTIFLGGYTLPGLAADGLHLPFGTQVALPHLAVVVLQVLVFTTKVFLVGCFQIHIRWTLPRFRFDQLMDLGWKVLFPVAAVNLVITAVVCWWVL
jgi:NADH-quinone oxidoreductase subunit H